MSSETTSSTASSRTQGQTSGATPTYTRLNGSDGLELSLAMPNRREFDYTVMFWFRSHKSLAELETDDSILNRKAFLFDLPGAASCYVTRTRDEGPSI